MALKFRTTGIRKSAMRRILLLVVLFFASLVFFYFLLNRRVDPDVSQMSEPTLPTLSVESFGTRQLMLHGYVQEMDSSEMDKDLIVIDSDRRLSFIVDTYGVDIDQASYEIHDLESSRTISTDQISSLSKNGSSVDFDVEFTNLLDPGRRYSLIVTLGFGEKSINYYSLLEISENAHMQEILAFASDFHEKSLSESYDSLGKYLEPDDTATSGDVSHVTIQSSVNDLGMQSFTHEVETDPVVAVTDMDTETASVSISYILRHEGTCFMATENYVIRYGSPRMFLLDFDRKLEIVPTSETFSVQDGSLLIGSTALAPELVTNESGSVGAFVLSGALYQYNVNQNRVTSVFSFFKDSKDLRCLYTEHDIRILNIDASGSMDFVVYGYMNSGSHEGQSGIDIYHYDSSLNVVTEEGFINSKDPLSYLQENFSELLYRTSGGRFYCLLNRKLLGIDLASKQTDVILSDLEDGQYCVSESMRYIAWTSSAAPGDVIQVRDLSSDKVYKIEARGSEKLRALCFLDEDLVYGTVSAENLDTGYMSSLAIVSFQTDKMTTVKTYEKRDRLISKVTVSDNALKLSRVRPDGSRASSDTILDTMTDTDSAAYLTSVSDETAGSIRAIAFSKLSSDLTGSPDYAVSGLVLSENVVSLDMY